MPNRQAASLEATAGSGSGRLSQRHVDCSCPAQEVTLVMKHLFGLIVLLALPRVASADDVSWINPHWQGISGYSGLFLTCTIGDDATLADREVEYALTGIAISEVNNKGKQVRLYGREMGIGATENPLVGFDTLTGYIALGSTNDVQLGTNRYIRAVRACNNNNSDHKLKGLQVMSAYIDDDEYIAEPGVADVYDQPNCDDWDSWVTCPEGEVGVAVRMNHENDAFIGIELQCAEVVWDP
jgi:hypothetical protein